MKEKELRLITINSDKDVEEKHIIKVENIKAPILLLSGIYGLKVSEILVNRVDAIMGM